MSEQPPPIERHAAADRFGKRALGAVHDITVALADGRRRCRRAGPAAPQRAAPQHRRTPGTHRRGARRRRRPRTRRRTRFRRTTSSRADTRPLRWARTALVGGERGKHARGRGHRGSASWRGSPCGAAPPASTSCTRGSPTAPSRRSVRPGGRSRCVHDAISGLSYSGVRLALGVGARAVGAVASLRASGRDLDGDRAGRVALAILNGAHGDLVAREAPGARARHDRPGGRPGRAGRRRRPCGEAFPDAGRPARGLPARAHRDRGLVGLRRRAAPRRPGGHLRQPAAAATSG